jgi:dUTP pyrophosphatase
MKIPTKRFDKTLPLPEYEPQAAGFDFVCRENTTIKPRELKTISANIAMAIPKGYTLLVVPRSSTPHRFGLSMPHSIGIVDPFYRGSDDELVLLVYNFSSKTVTVKHGDKIAQGILVKYETVEFDESKQLSPSAIGKWKQPKRRKS